jgi:hypothetical protein
VDATCSTLEDRTRDPSRAAAARSAGRGERQFPGRHRLNLNALDRGRAHHRRHIPFDQFFPHGLAEHCPRGVVDDLDRARAQSIGSFVCKQCSYVCGSERAEVHAAERRKDMKTQRLPVARECRGTQTGPDDVLEPVSAKRSRVHDSTARGRPALVFAIKTASWSATSFRVLPYTDRRTRLPSGRKT